MDPAVAQVIHTGKSREVLQKIRVEKNLDIKLLKYKGAIGVDVAQKQLKGQKTDRLGITIYVKKKLAREELSTEEAIPAEIEGIPTDVVECPNVWPSPEASEQGAGIQAKLQTPILEGGLSISNQFNLGGFGTLGVVIESSGVPTALSCAHVMLGQGVIEPGGPQGGTWPADRIGTVSFLSYGPYNVDVALTPISGRFTNVGNVMKIGKIAGYGSAVIGQPVRKTGATTSYTEGIVSSKTLTWTTVDPNLGTAIFTNQVKVDNVGTDFALPGDSGSAVIDGSFMMIGMVVAGSPGSFTVCNPSEDLAKIIPGNISFSAEEKEK